MAGTCHGPPMPEHGSTKKPENAHSEAVLSTKSQSTKMTAEHAHSWAVDPDQPGFACLHCRVSGWHWHKGELKRLWDRLRIRTEEANCLELECAHLRAELQVWQQRLGDSQATVLRLEAVVGAAANVRDSYQPLREALDAVTQRAEPEPSAA